MDLAVHERNEGRRTRAVTAFLVFRIAIEDIEEGVAWKMDVSVFCTSLVKSCCKKSEALNFSYL